MKLPESPYRITFLTHAYPFLHIFLTLHPYNLLMKTVLIIVILLLAAGTLLFFVSNRPAQPSLTTDTEVTTSPTVDTSLSGTPDTSALRAGGSSYRDPDGMYTFLYPSDYVLDEQGENRVRIYKRAPSARPQGEMTDGVILEFETVRLQGQTLQQWIAARVNQSDPDDTLPLAERSQATVLNTYPGYIYAVSDSGDTSQIVVQRTAGADTAVNIMTLIQDPQGNNYRREVDAILSTLELL